MLKTVYFPVAISLILFLMSWEMEHVKAYDYDEALAKIETLPKRHFKIPQVLNNVKPHGVNVPQLHLETVHAQADPAVAHLSSAGNDAKNAMNDATKTLSQLYMTIRNIALPQSDTNHTQQRLVMLLPGKVLNYYDYYPGSKYEEVMKNSDHNGTQVNIPVRVMENMFALADVVPGIDPLHGADTGESLAEMYGNLLNWMQIKGFDNKTHEEKKNYLKAVEYLTQKVPDPLNVSANVTRYNLYRRSQDAYNTKRLEMEDTIAAQRQNQPAPNFESWFQRTYPLLNGAVEAAYTEWLIIGEKEIVELYKSYLDVQAPGIDLENARMALRAAGVISLDRSRTVYPVSFVPSNWYRYLTKVTKVDQANKYSALSGDQIRLQIGQLEAKKTMLLAMQNAAISNEAKQALEEAKISTESADKELKNAAEKAEMNRQKCLANRCRISQNAINCSDFTKSSDATSEIIDLYSQKYSCVGSLDSQLNSTIQKQDYEKLIKGIDSSIKELNKALTGSGVPLSQLAQHAADSQEQLDSQWLQFQFDSSTSSQQTDGSSSHSSIGTSASADCMFFSASASYSTSNKQRNFKAQMNKAKIGVKGELLRVIIQRPWFRPSLFRSAEYVLNTNFLVSPGDDLTENDFLNKVRNRTVYYLPHYASGLLLSRNVEVEFRDLNSSAVYQALQQSSSFSSDFSVGGFWAGSAKASASGSWENSVSSAKVEGSETGLRVKIPGAQIIGYYTQHVPRFPR